MLHFAGIGDIVPSVEHPVDYMNTNIMGTVRSGGEQDSGCASICLMQPHLLLRRQSTDADTRTGANCDRVSLRSIKILGEQAAFHWMHVYGLSVNSIRIFNAYGTRSRTSGAYGAVFGVFLKQKLAGAPFTVVGDGTQSRDFVRYGCSGGIRSGRGV